MQKIITLFIFLLVSSCTIAHKRPPSLYSLELFDTVSKDENYIQNKLIELTFITCRKRWFSDGGKSKDYLRGKFKIKYGMELYGLSNIEMEITHIVDSSIFIPNEICHRLTGNPVTKERIEINEAEKWEVVNPAHHIH